jgi:cytochrome c-type biogenesis protein CcmF
LSEYVQGSKVTVGAPFYNRVNLPIGLFLLFLTGIGPLLAWRSTSLRSIRRNFILPGIAMAVTFVVCIACGVRPWSAGDDMQAEIFSLITFTLAAGVITAIASEFLRGAGVVRTQTGKNLFASTILLVRRNTRRYGGYVVHFGIVVMFIGIAGGAFNQSREQEMGFGDTMQLGRYKLVCQSFTQDSNPNFDTEYALLDVFKGDKKITQLAPERRFYIASQTTSTMVALHSTLAQDLYVIYEGKNPDTDKPIIKVFLNPLINWIWIGVLIVVVGTFLALVPNLTRSPARAPATVTSPAIGEAEVHHA